MHIDDVFDLIQLEINNIDKVNGQIFNVGGGLENSISLLELTKLCEEFTGNKININSANEDRPADLISYVTDNSKIEKTLNWKPKKNITDLVKETTDWITEYQDILKSILN